MCPIHIARKKARRAPCLCMNFRTIALLFRHSSHAFLLWLSCMRRRADDRQNEGANWTINTSPFPLPLPRQVYCTPFASVTRLPAVPELPDKPRRMCRCTVSTNSDLEHTVIRSRASRGTEWVDHLSRRVGRASYPRRSAKPTRPTRWPSRNRAQSTTPVRTERQKMSVVRQLADSELCIKKGLPPVLKE